MLDVQIASQLGEVIVKGEGGVTVEVRQFLEGYSYTGDMEDGEWREYTECRGGAGGLAGGVG